MRLNDADIVAISAFLGMSEYDFIQTHTRLRPRRDGLALLDKPNGECAFLEGIDCMIQPVKPHQQILPRHGRVQRAYRGNAGNPDGKISRLLHANEHRYVVAHLAQAALLVGFRRDENDEPHNDGTSAFSVRVMTK